MFQISVQQYLLFLIKLAHQKYEFVQQDFDAKELFLSWRDE